VQPDRPEFQPQALIRTLIDHKVDFVVVGGLAAMSHGSAYPSFDLDVAYARDRTNLERLARALRDLQATLRGAPADLPFQIDAESLVAGGHFTFATRFGALDVLDTPDGAPRYAELRAAAVRSTIQGEPVLIASLDHMIAMKEAAGRPHDKAVAAELRAISDELRAR
jgi:hypothetical protein